MNNIHKQILDQLHIGVQYALGCTEPVAVALAVATADEQVDGDIEKIKVITSPNIYKNGMGVGIPGTHLIGLDYAAVLGAVCGDASLGLEVLDPINDGCVAVSEDIISDDKVSVTTMERDQNFYIDALIEKSGGTARVIIHDTHTNVVYIQKDEDVILNNIEPGEQVKAPASDAFLKDLDIKDMVEFAENVDFEDIEFLLEGVEVNKKIAEYGLEHKSGAGIGAGMQILMDKGLLCSGVTNRAKILAASASDARMAGVKMPVMSSGSSGNQGITAILPVYSVWEEYKSGDEEALSRALAISHSVTAFVKAFLGNLAPTCGCAIAAGIGASAAVVWLMDGTVEEMEIAIKNIIGSLSGMVCDGAKGGCALKIATATQESISQAFLAMEGIEVNSLDGILAPTAKQSIINLAEFSHDGMRDADNTIIDIMLENQKNL